MYPETIKKMKPCSVKCIVHYLENGISGESDYIDKQENEENEDNELFACQVERYDPEIASVKYDQRENPCDYIINQFSWLLQRSDRMRKVNDNGQAENKQVEKQAELPAFPGLVTGGFLHAANYTNLF
jgi:hypothetical protein